MADLSHRRQPSLPRKGHHCPPLQNSRKVFPTCQYWPGRVVFRKRLQKMTGCDGKSERMRARSFFQNRSLISSQSELFVSSPKLQVSHACDVSNFKFTPTLHDIPQPERIQTACFMKVPSRRHQDTITDSNINLTISVLARAERSLRHRVVRSYNQSPKSTPKVGRTQHTPYSKAFCAYLLPSIHTRAIHRGRRMSMSYTALESGFVSRIPIILEMPENG
jgi:hypothetical protein